jgi:hypothetical protein
LALQIKGKIAQLLKPESGVSKVGNSWTKREFVIETEEQFPKKVCFTLFGDKSTLVDGFSAGDEVEVSFNIDAKEYNGKWFNSVNAWKIERVSNESGSEYLPPPPPPFFSESDIPLPSSSEGDDDGLPF